MTEAKSVNVSYNFDLRSHVIAILAMAAKKLLAKGQTNSLCQTNMSPVCICEVSNRKTLSGETFCFLEKRWLSIFKFCASSNLLFFFYKLLIGPQPTFLECIVIFL